MNMNIEAREKKTVYQMYLYYNQRLESVGNNSTKLVNKYLFSIEKEWLEPDPNNPPDIADIILEDYFLDIDNAILDISDSIPSEIRDDFNRSNIVSLLCEKVTELIEKLN